MFTTYENNQCSKLMFTTDGYNRCSQLMFTTDVHIYWLKFMVTTMCYTNVHNFCIKPFVSRRADPRRLESKSPWSTKPAIRTNVWRLAKGTGRDIFPHWSKIEANRERLETGPFRIKSIHIRWISAIRISGFATPALHFAQSMEIN